MRGSEKSLFIAAGVSNDKSKKKKLKMPLLILNKRRKAMF